MMFEDRLTVHLKHSLDNYFNLLDWTGFTEKGVPERLMVLAAIEELMHSPMSLYITDDDLKILQNALTCILGSDCLIPLMAGEDYFTGDSMNFRDMVLRISEEEAFRLTEDGYFRIPDTV